MFGDHATHVMREGKRWLVATSTWSDSRRRAGAHGRAGRRHPRGDDRRPSPSAAPAGHPSLDLPTDQPSVGVWDPHLVRDDDGSWLVGYVGAHILDFHPVLAAGGTVARRTHPAWRRDRPYGDRGARLARLDRRVAGPRQRRSRQRAARQGGLPRVRRVDARGRDPGTRRTRQHSVADRGAAGPRRAGRPLAAGDLEPDAVRRRTHGLQDQAVALLVLRALAEHPFM